MQRITRAILLLLALHSTSAATRYVDANSANPTPPFTNWATAATVIQDAVDAADPGDEVLVTNGVYATGGRAVVGTMTNRVAVTKPLTLRSINGPELTVIEGYQVPGVTNGDGAIRCVYLTNGTVLSGFTLTKGATVNAGNYDAQEAGGGVWCESTDAWITNCTLMGNSAPAFGGGAYQGTLINCALTGNAGAWIGGGVDRGTLTDCTLRGNSADNGGGASESTLINCLLTGNLAGLGGGAWECTLSNCILAANRAEESGGGTCQGNLNNCTVTGNSARERGGGVYWGTHYNSILYYNKANEGPNDYRGTLDYCCTTPMPLWGLGNIAEDPELASTSHLSARSPCRGAGSAAYATGLDIDSEAWLNPPSIGCDEYWSGAVTGAVTVTISASWTSVAAGFPVDLTGWIDGRVSASVWDFADGTRVTNRPYASHAWATPGDYPVTLTAYNEDHPDGVGGILTIRVVAQPAHYASVGSPSPVPPYSSWETAAVTIQEAVDAALPGGTVLVTNGVYATGGRAVYGLMTNRVAVTKPLTLRSVNGPAVTVIEGYQVPGTTNGDGAIRCVYLTDGAVLSGFTLTKGATRNAGHSYYEQSAGGVWCASAGALVTNCTITGNSACFAGGGAHPGTLNNCLLSWNSALDSGGAFGGVLNSCALIGNSAQRFGGGTRDNRLNHCTVTGNSAGTSGGGALQAELTDCILYDNTAVSGPNYTSGSLDRCCTSPLPASGVGNIDADPLFVDRLNGDLRLRPDSPCINAGNNAYASGTTDMDGNPRIVGGTVDIGAYEFQTPTSLLSYAWAQQYGLPTDSSADFTDTDTDLLNNWQEWRVGTIPTNALSVLRLLTPISDGTNLTITWESVANRNYFLEHRPDLSSTSAFTRFATNISGQTSRTSFLDTNAAGASPRFYRVGVE
jgi:hypothetical protein